LSKSISSQASGSALQRARLLPQMPSFFGLSRIAISSPTLHLERRDVHLAAVDFDVSVANNLARLTAADGEAETVATLSRRRSSCWRAVRR
jgi:hypothetical protein